MRGLVFIQNNNLTKIYPHHYRVVLMETLPTSTANVAREFLSSQRNIHVIHLQEIHYLQWCGGGHRYYIGDPPGIVYNSETQSQISIIDGLPVATLLEMNDLASGQKKFDTISESHQ